MVEMSTLYEDWTKIRHKELPNSSGELGSILRLREDEHLRLDIWNHTYSDVGVVIWNFHGDYYLFRESESHIFPDCIESSSIHYIYTKLMRIALSP
jgi:hypothetical protein